MRSKVIVLVALLIGTLGGMTLRGAIAPARAQGAPPSYEYRSVYLEKYTPEDVSRFCNSLGSEGFLLSGVIPATPYGSAVMVFARTVP